MNINMYIVNGLLMCMAILATIGMFAVIWFLFKERFVVYKSHTINILQPDGTYKKHTTHSTGWLWNRN